LKEATTEENVLRLCDGEGPRKEEEERETMHCGRMDFNEAAVHVAE